MNNKFIGFISLVLLIVTILITSSMGSSQTISLRSLAEQRGFKIGSSVLIPPLQNPIYSSLLSWEFNTITPEYDLKFKPIHPERSRFDFTGADTIVNFAKANNMDVRGHTLVWHESQPAWLAEGNFTKEELKTILQNHIQTVVSHYPDIKIWDVVNEAIADSNSLRESLWLKTIGNEYIEQAFRWAHQANPGAKLFYNDYGGEGMGDKSNAIYELVKDLKQRGVPIDGVGLQMHVSINSAPNPEAVTANIKRLEALGLEVQITEMDVRIQDATGTLPEKLAAQAEVYQNMMNVCLATKNCTAFVMWGVSDAVSWIPRYLKQPDSPLIFDENYQPKPAYNALVKALQSD